MPTNNGYITKLTKAPLQEVVFEAFWELDVDPQSRENFDPGFELAQGVFADTVKKDYPFYKKIVPSIVPPHFLNQKPVHQFWRGDGQWPVLQLGPGLLAVNDTEKTYVWESAYRPAIEYGLDALLKSYKEPPRFQKVSLRYIDAFELGDEFKEDFVKYIEANLQIQVIKGFEVQGAISNQNLIQAYTLGDGSKLTLVVSDGSRSNKPAVILQIAVVREGQLAVDDIKNWISSAHSVTSNLFKQMLRKEFYASLK
ncbi:MAG: TIGR04255 family protein [Bacteroidota bacterium]|jgi:uncharacterized protein (TIGR04255 family)